jgi:hypothetical protein
MKRRLERIEESIARYITQLETADRRGDAMPEAKVERFKDKIAKLNEEIARLSVNHAEMVKSKDKQISLPDPDARSMATSGMDTGIVGYNVQAAVDTKNHLIEAGPTAEVRRFTQSLREPAATVAPYYRVGLAVRSCVVNFRTRSTLALFEYFQRPVGVHGHYQLAADHLEHGQVGIDHERYALQRQHRNPPPHPELTCDHLITIG